MATATTTASSGGFLGSVGPLLAALVNSPLLAERRIKITVAGRDVDARPILREVASALADGKITPAEIQGLIAQVTLAVLTAPPHVQPVPAQSPLISATLVLPSPDPIVATSLKITKIVAEGLFFEGPRDASDADNPGIAGKLYGPREVQLKGWRAHCNFTPFAGNIRIPDEINRRWMADGHSPLVQPRWGRVVGGRDIINTSGIGESDHWGLQAYDRASSPNAGWTHVLLLEEQLVDGQADCFDYVFIPAEFNEGTEVKSDRLTWKAD